MSKQDVTEILKWTGLTAVLVVGLFWSQAADSADPAGPPRPMIAVGDLKISAEARPARDPYRVALSITIENPTATPKRLDLPLSLIRQEFTGNPLARTIGPMDTKNTVERRETFHFSVPASKTTVRTVVLPIQARPTATTARIATVAPLDLPAPPSMPTIPPTYTVSIDGVKQGDLADFPAGLVWPRE